jgi:hypothetical protein
LALVGGALLPLLARAAASGPNNSLADFSVLVVA